MYVGAMGGAPPGPEQPFVLGRYAVYGVISPGGGSSVHYARLLGMGGFARTVAIKRIDPSLAAAARELLGGARRLTRIRHTNIVPTVDVVAERGELYLVMEYVPGETLERLLRPLGERGERVPPRVACGIVAGMMRGLHAAHDAKASKGTALGLVHGDLAPHNVLCGADGVARLLDFGLARAQLPYAAPEQLRGPATPQSDIYAAGLILWEAITGRSPVRGASDAETMERIEASVIEPPSKLVLGVPREIDIIALRALAREPRARYATAKEMARDSRGVHRRRGDERRRRVGGEERRPGARASRGDRPRDRARGAAGSAAERARAAADASPRGTRQRRVPRRARARSADARARERRGDVRARAPRARDDEAVDRPPPHVRARRVRARVRGRRGRAHDPLPRPARPDEPRARPRRAPAAARRVGGLRKIARTAHARPCARAEGDQP